MCLNKQFSETILFIFIPEYGQSNEPQKTTPETNYNYSPKRPEMATGGYLPGRKAAR